MTVQLDFVADTPVAERIDQLAQELQMAARFDRPAILLAVFRSEWVRQEAEELLAIRLREIGQQVESVFVNPQNADLPSYLREHANSQGTVFFVSGLQFGGGQDGRNAYRALNYRREYFIDYRLRVVFWLTEQEEREVARSAPDFWAFRHRVLVFLDPPQPEQITTLASSLALQDWSDDTWDPDMTARIEWRKKLLTELPDTEEMAATRSDLLYDLSQLYINQGSYKEAENLSRQALAIREHVWGEGHPSIVESLEQMGMLLQSMGDYEAARPYFERVLAIRELKSGHDHPLTARTLNLMGGLLQSEGDYFGAQGYFERAMAIVEKNGADTLLMANILNDLGVLLIEMGSYGEAKLYLERALTIRESWLGIDHPLTASSLIALGKLLDVMGDWHNARDYYEKALAIREKTLGTEHPATASNLDKLGMLLAGIDYKQAKAYVERALVIREKVLGADHPLTAESLNHLAMLLEWAGDCEEARMCYERAVRILNTKLGPNHPKTKIVRDNLASFIGDDTSQ